MAQTLRWRPWLHARRVHIIRMWRFQTLTPLWLQVLKVLSRKRINRDGAPSAVLAAAVAQLRTPLTTRAAAEAANVILNLCYESANVDAVTLAGGAAPLATALASADPQLQGNAAGAVQSICYQRKGRVAMRDVGLVPRLVELLHAEHAKVATRAVGALHNVSSDAEAIRIIRRWIFCHRDSACAMLASCAKRDIPVDVIVCVCRLRIATCQAHDAILETVHALQRMWQEIVVQEQRHTQACEAAQQCGRCGRSVSGRRAAECCPRSGEPHAHLRHGLHRAACTAAVMRRRHRAGAMYRCLCSASCLQQCDKPAPSCVNMVRYACIAVCVCIKLSSPRRHKPIETIEPSEVVAAGVCCRRAAQHSGATRQQARGRAAAQHVQAHEPRDGDERRLRRLLRSAAAVGSGVTWRMCEVTTMGSMAASGAGDWHGRVVWLETPARSVRHLSLCALDRHKNVFSARPGRNVFALCDCLACTCTGQRVHTGHETCAAEHETCANLATPYNAMQFSRTASGCRTMSTHRHNAQQQDATSAKGFVMRSHHCPSEFPCTTIL